MDEVTHTILPNGGGLSGTALGAGFGGLIGSWLGNGFGGFMNSQELRVKFSFMWLRESGFRRHRENQHVK